VENIKTCYTACPVIKREEHISPAPGFLPASFSRARLAAPSLSPGCASGTVESRNYHETNDILTKISRSFSLGTFVHLPLFAGKRLS
jgi:hypothetical protein